MEAAEDDDAAGAVVGVVVVVVVVLFAAAAAPRKLPNCIHLSKCGANRKALTSRLQMVHVVNFLGSLGGRRFHISL